MTPQNQQVNPENWEEHRKRIEEEDSYQKLSPQEQKLRLAQEQQAFEESKNKLRTDFGFRPFDSKSHQSKTPTDSEKAQQERELAELDSLIAAAPTDSSQSEAPKFPQKALDTSEKKFETPETMKKFLTVYEETSKNIEEKKFIDFPTFSIDDFGCQVTQRVQITRITDHSEPNQKNTSTYQHLKDKKCSPNNIGMVVQIEKVAENKHGLNSISMEIPMVVLLDGTFKDFIKNYTETVLFAMLCYEHQQKKAAITPNFSHEENKKQPLDRQNTVSEQSNKMGITSLYQNGKAVAFNSGLANRNTSSVSFSCNNGAIWGTFDQLKSQQNPKELPEALDKISREQ